MSQRYPFNNFDNFLQNQFYVPRELYSPSSSEYEAESNLISFQDIFNFGDRNTNEITNEERNNSDENRRNDIVININSSNSQENRLLGRRRRGEDNSNSVHTRYSDDNSRRKVKRIILLGRRRRGEDNSNSVHTRYSDDNSRRKVKRIIITELQNFINLRIEYIYGNDIGEGMLKKRLMKLCQKQISDASIQFNLEFLNKTLKEIFSENVTGRITNYSSDRNKEIIEELINDKDEVKRKYFEGLFSLTFLDCLKYFRDEQDFDNEYLRGFKKFNQMKDKFEEKNGKQYTEHICEYLNKYD